MNDEDEDTDSLTINNLQLLLISYINFSGSIFVALQTPTYHPSLTESVLAIASFSLPFTSIILPATFEVYPGSLFEP